MTPDTEVVRLPFGLCAIYVLREPPPPQLARSPADYPAPWEQLDISPEDDGCPF